jgi:hypothetical protein
MCHGCPAVLDQKNLARPEGFEPPTYGSLSFGERPRAVDLGAGPLPRQSTHDQQKNDAADERNDDRPDIDARSSCMAEKPKDPSADHRADDTDY